MVIAYDRRNENEDTIVFERDGHYEIQARRDFVPVRIEIVNNDGEEAYNRAEEIFSSWSV